MPQEIKPQEEQDTRAEQYRWIKFLPLTPEEQALQDKLQAKAEEYDLYIRNDRPYSHPAPPGLGGYQLPEGADYSINEMGPPILRIVGDENELRSGYAGGPAGPAGGGGVLLVGRGATKDPDVLDFSIAHEIGHRLDRDDYDSDVHAASIIGPQRAINALAKLGDELTSRGETFHLSENPYTREDRDNFLREFGIELDSHGSIRQRQEFIVKLFPEVQLVIPDPLVKPAENPALAAKELADKLANELKKFFDMDKPQVVGQANGGNVPDSMKTDAPTPPEVAPPMPTPSAPTAR